MVYVHYRAKLDVPHGEGDGDPNLTPYTTVTPRWNVDLNMQLKQRSHYEITQEDLLIALE